MASTHQTQSKWQPHLPLGAPLHTCDGPFVQMDTKAEHDVTSIQWAFTAERLKPIEVCKLHDF